MISKASYVRCDHCGDPAPATIEGAVEARRVAGVEASYVRYKRKDLCCACYSALLKSVRRADG